MMHSGSFSEVRSSQNKVLQIRTMLFKQLSLSPMQMIAALRVAVRGLSSCWMVESCRVEQSWIRAGQNDVSQWMTGVRRGVRGLWGFFSLLICPHSFAVAVPLSRLTVKVRASSSCPSRSPSPSSSVRWQVFLWEPARAQLTDTRG